MGSNWPQNFTLKEMIKTEHSEILNFPDTWEKFLNLLLTAGVLQYLRNEIKKPIIVNSGYRSKRLNDKVGGSKTSAHLQGLAADITCKNKADNEKVLSLVEAAKDVLSIDQIIVYRDKKKTVQWLHIGLCNLSKRKPRGQVLEKFV